MSKNADWARKAVESKLFKFGIVASLLLILLAVFMIGNFLYKIYILDYRFDDGELYPPTEESFQSLI